MICLTAKRRGTHKTKKCSERLLGACLYKNHDTSLVSGHEELYVPVVNVLAVLLLESPLGLYSGCREADHGVTVGADLAVALHLDAFCGQLEQGEF